jgi:hypothetical protein
MMHTSSKAVARESMTRAARWAMAAKASKLLNLHVEATTARVLRTARAGRGARTVNLVSFPLAARVSNVVSLHRVVNKVRAVKVVSLRQAIKVILVFSIPAKAAMLPTFAHLTWVAKTARSVKISKALKTLHTPQVVKVKEPAVLVKTAAGNSKCRRVAVQVATQRRDLHLQVVSIKAVAIRAVAIRTVPLMLIVDVMKTIVRVCSPMVAF